MLPDLQKSEKLAFSSNIKEGLDKNTVALAFCTAIVAKNQVEGAVTAALLVC
jgi:hypothetical protein